MQYLLHIKVGEKLKERMELLVESGFFNNYSEIIREGLRDKLSDFSHKNYQKRK